MKIIVFILVLVVTMASCKHDPLVFEGPVPLPEGSAEISFQDEILPLLLSNCAMSGCHDALTREEGIQLTDYSNVLKIVKANNPGDSELYEVITESDQDKRMPPPPRNPLNQAQIEMVRNWINEGARNTFRPEGNCDTVTVSYASTVRLVLDQYCVGCHNNSLSEGGLNLTIFSQIQQKQTQIYQRISLSRQDPSYMPKGGLLSDCKTNQLKAWIHQGAQQN